MSDERPVVGGTVALILWLVGVVPFFFSTQHTWQQCSQKSVADIIYPNRDSRRLCLAATSALIGHMIWMHRRVCWLRRWGMGAGSAVICSGAHVAMVDNARGICKSFMKSFISGIIVVQTNPTLYTLKPRSSHVENLRSVWSWSAEIFESHTHTHTHRHRHTHTHTHTQISCFDREMLFYSGDCSGRGTWLLGVSQLFGGSAQDWGMLWSGPASCKLLPHCRPVGLCHRQGNQLKITCVSSM